MKDKALNKITEVLDRYLAKFDCECIGVDTDFYCYPDTKEVAYSLTFVADNDKYFNKLFKHLGLKYNADPFILALYHEIGHCMTWNNFNKIDIAYIKIAKAIIDNGKPNKIKRIIYPILLDEYKATKWACKYINSHPQEIKAMLENIQPLILQFYKENGLTN